MKYEINGRPLEFPFGKLEGLAIYINGTDLPDEVYQTCDINFVVETINQKIADQGAIQGYWQGATETALFHGVSVFDGEPATIRNRKQNQPRLVNH